MFFDPNPFWRRLERGVAVPIHAEFTAFVLNESAHFP